MSQFRYLLFLAVQLYCPVAKADLAVPVMVGGHGELDACGAVGVVSGLKPDGDGFLAVRAGPSTNYPLLDKLKNGRFLYICNLKNEKWLGVVYSNSLNSDCEVSSPINPSVPYSGPCSSGWVHKAWIKTIAG